MSKPSLASRTAVALPMPESEPVIIAVFAMPPAYPAAAPPCRRPGGSPRSQRAKRQEDPNPNASGARLSCREVHVGHVPCPWVLEQAPLGASGHVAAEAVAEPPAPLRPEPRAPDPDSFGEGKTVVGDHRRVDRLLRWSENRISYASSSARRAIPSRLRSRPVSRGWGTS